MPEINYRRDFRDWWRCDLVCEGHITKHHRLNDLRELNLLIVLEARNSKSRYRVGFFRGLSPWLMDGHS